MQKHFRSVMSPILLTLQNMRSIMRLTGKFRTVLGGCFEICLYEKYVCSFKIRISLNSGMMDLSHVLGILTNNFKIDSKIFQDAHHVSNISTTVSELRTSQESDICLSVKSSFVELSRIELTEH